MNRRAHATYTVMNSSTLHKAYIRAIPFEILRGGLETKNTNVGVGGVREKIKRGSLQKSTVWVEASAKKIKCVVGVQDFFQSFPPEDLKWSSPKELMYIYTLGRTLARSTV